MIYKNGKNIISVYKGLTPITKIYKGLNVIWEAFKNFVVSGIPPLTLTNSIGEPLVDYKIYGNTKQSLLPDEYQQVEYIEATGEQYFELNYIPNNKTNSRGKFQVTNTSTASILFGARQKSAASNFYGFNWGGGSPYKWVNSYYTGKTTEVRIDNKVHTFDKKAGVLKLDGNEIGNYTPSVTTWNTTYKMIVFGCNTGGTVGLNPEARLSYLAIDEGEGDLFVLVSCYRKSDGEIGMYDVVNNVFHTNQGTGTFLKGADITPIPTPDNPIYFKSVGDKTEDNEPYDYQIHILNNEIVTNIYLNEPLRKIGDYADYLDFENQTITSNVKSIILTGNEDIYSNQKISGFQYVSISKRSIGTNLTILPEQTNLLKTTHFETVTNVSTPREHTVYIGQSYINFNLDNVNDIETFKTFLGEQYANNTPVILIYPIPTETSTIELPTIPTIQGTNVLSIDTTIQPSNIEITYKGK